MGEWSYLTVVDDVGHERAFLGGKRMVPLLWLLAFEPGDHVGSRLRAPLALAKERLRDRAAALQVGPTLRAKLCGFVTHVVSLQGAYLVLDVTELHEAHGYRAELLRLVSLDPATCELDDWDEALDREDGVLELTDDPYWAFGSDVNAVGMPWLDASTA